MPLATNDTAQASLRKTCLTEASNEPTVARVLVTAGKQARQLTPTGVDASANNGNDTALTNELKKAGVFIRSSG